jgi:hypothetical protein
MGVAKNYAERIQGVPFELEGDSPPTAIHNSTTTALCAVTSTISLKGDNGADPNKLVKVTDRISE